jgi:hypothetical protein
VFDGRPLASGPQRAGDGSDGRRPALTCTGREGHAHRPRARAGSRRHPARHGRRCQHPRRRRRVRLFLCAHRRRRLGSVAARGRSRRDRSGLRHPLARRKQRQGIEIPVGLGGQAHAEVDVRLGMLGLAARANRADDVPLRDCRPDPDRNRPELDERHREAVRGPNREREPRARHQPREADAARGGSAHVGPRRCSDVDAAMLAARVRIVHGLETTQHGPVDRPGPGARGRRSCQREHAGAEEQGRSSVASFENHGPAPYQGGRLLSNMATETCDRGGSAARRSSARRSPQPASDPDPQ